MLQFVYTLLFLFFGFQTSLNAVIYLEPTPQFKPRIEVIGVFIEDNDKILLLHRQDGKSQGNLWGIPGGKLEKSETPLQAAIREVKEETGFDISNQPVTYLGKVFIEYNNKDHFVYHMAKTQLKDSPGDVQITIKEHKGFTWVTPNDALKMALLQDEDPCIRLIYHDSWSGK